MPDPGCCDRCRALADAGPDSNTAESCASCGFYSEFGHNDHCRLILALAQPCPLALLRRAAADATGPAKEALLGVLAEATR